MTRLTRLFSTFLVVTLATPASLAMAGSNGSDPAGPAAKSAPAAEAAPVIPIVIRDGSLLAATARLAADAAKWEQTKVQGRVPVSRPVNRRIRAQGAGGTVMMLVSTIAGIAGTVYMLKYLKDQQKDSEG